MLPTAAALVRKTGDLKRYPTGRAVTIAPCKMSHSHRPIPGFVPASDAVTSITLQEVLADHAIVIVHFWAVWNGADPPMDSLIADLRGRLPFDARFVSCNVDDPACVDLCKHVGVVNIPYLAVYVDGKQRRGIMGLQEAESLIAELVDRVTNPGSQRRWWRFW